MIYDLEFTNFGPHSRFRQILQAGVNLFLGPNGGGKSNIVYGIGWVILGVRALPPAYSQKDIIKDGTSEVSGSVTLDFVGRRLTFSRWFNGKTTRARVVDADTGEVLADNATGVTAFLSSHGFDWDAASVPFCRQRDLDAFVHESPANRKKIIESLLQLEDLVAALKWLRAKKKDLPPLVDEPDPEVLDQRVKMTQADVAAAAEGLKQVKIAASVAEQELSQATLALPTDEYAVDREQAQQTTSAFAAEILVLERRAEPLMSSAEPKVDCTDQINTYTEAIAAQQKTLDEWAAQETRLNGLVRDHDVRHTAFKTLVDGIDTECPICKSVVTPLSLEDAKHRAEGEPPPHPYTEELQEAAANIETIRIYLRAATTHLKDVQTEQETFLLQEARKAELQSLNEQVDITTNQLSDAQKVLDALPAPPNKAAFANVRSLTTTHQAAQMEVLTWEREVSKCEQVDAAAATDFLEAVALIADQVERRKLMETVKQTETAFKTFRDQLLRGALTWVSGRATQVLQASGDMAVAPAGSRLELDDKLVYSVVLPDGTSQPVYRVSGGQAAVFSTCLRIALSEYLAGRMGMNGLLLLDAIFEPMNADNRAIAAHAITAYGPPQTLIFSYFDVPELGANIIPVG